MPLHPEILARINALGGDTRRVTGASLADDLASITFDTVLYPRPEDNLPWATGDDEESIYGLDGYIAEHAATLAASPETFYREMLAHFYCFTDEAYGQDFWIAEPFTPYQVGTSDHDEWADEFENPDPDDEYAVNLTPIIEHTGCARPDFIRLFYRYSYPDNLYICLQDPKPENPTLWGTDHELFFTEISNEGSLKDWLNRYMTQDELLAIVQTAIANQAAAH